MTSKLRPMPPLSSEAPPEVLPGQAHGGKLEELAAGCGSGHEFAQIAISYLGNSLENPWEEPLRSEAVDPGEVRTDRCGRYPYVGRSTMQSAETSIPTRNVLIMLAMAGGMWALVFMLAIGVIELWPRHLATEVAAGDAATSEAVIGDEIAAMDSLHDRPQVIYRPQLITRAHVATMAKRKKRLGRSLAARIFNRSTSIN